MHAEAKGMQTSSEWALQEALTSAASNYAGPGSVLLPSPSLMLTRARLEMQRKVRHTWQGSACPLSFPLIGTSIKLSNMRPLCGCPLLHASLLC